MYPGKRALDLIVGTTAALLTLPILLVAALVSTVAFGSWPFFVQERIGLHGQPFRFVKIRTLPKSTPPYLDKYDLDLSDLSAGMRLMRRMHIDELPQLWHVVSGRMSLVGPRPDMTHMVERMTRDVAVSRQQVRPGLTGLWQVSTDCTRLIVECPEHDSLYLDHASPTLDRWILLKTIRKVLTGRTVSLEEVPETVLSPLLVPAQAPSREPVPSEASSR